MSSWFIRSNLYVAICAAALAYVTYVSLGVPAIAWAWPPPPAVVLLLSATLFVYNLDRLSPAAREDRGGAYLVTREPSRALGRVMWGMMLGSVVPMAWCAWVMPWRLVLALMPAALIALGYAVPLVYWRGTWRRLKEIPGMKIVLIALVWSIATVAIPAWEQGIAPWSREVMLEALSRALFIAAITLPFDVRDMARDEHAGIFTLPIWLGVRRTRVLGVALLCTMLAIQGALHGLYAASLFWPVLGTTLLTGLLIGCVGEDRPERFYAVYMEGTMGCYAVLMCAWWALR